MVVRPATSVDAEAVAEIYAPYVRDTAISFETVAPDGGEMRRRIETTMEQFPWLVGDVDGRVVGYAYASAHRTREAYQWSADVSVYLDARWHGRGLGRTLYTDLFGRLVRQGYVNAYAGITLPNAKSVGLHEALGFTPVGTYRTVGFKLGAWRDVGWWHLQLQPTPAEPAPPVSWRALTV